MYERKLPMNLNCALDLKNNLIGILLAITLLPFSGCRSQSLSVNSTRGSDSTSSIGRTLPAWQKGYLDIHAINTGRGETTLCIFPDGTTMLVDAAGSLISPADAIPPPPQKPNGSISPGLAIANYTSHFIKSASGKLNYIMMSHFDPDHMGSMDSGLPMHVSNSFRMGGVTEVGAKIRFDKILDRDYPNYDYPNYKASDPRIANYINFIKWSKKAYNAKAEQFVAGRNDQIVLKQDPAKYPDFEVRNIVSNGRVWTGSGTETINTLPAAEEVVAARAKENVFSIGFIMSYGKFNYFSGGDLQYNDRTDHPWKDIEAPVAKVVKSVDVMKANHHATANCNSKELLEKLAPQVVLVHNWRDIQPNPATISRMFDANNTCQIFTTNMSDANKVRLDTNLPKLKSTQGHIVVRVAPGGEEYSIYVLDDSNMEYKVKKVFGPYRSK